MDAIHDDIAEFALQLTRLKDSTDRSYAALARRLDMNASTLHRYCAGEAVPTDFTRIERFAAHCGASPEERVELHRRWILAVAARQRPRPSDARRAPTPQDTTGTVAPAASASHSSPADKAPGSASPADPRPGPTAPADRWPLAGRPRRRPVRSLAVAASLALALAGLTASAAGPAAGGGGTSPSARTTRELSEPSAPTTHDDSGPQAAAEPPSGGGGASPSARTTREPSEPSAPATHSDGRPQQDRASADPVPLTWTANSQLWQRECDHNYVIAKPPQEVPPPPNPADAAVWAASQQAVHGRTTDLRISVQGRGSAAVVLEALHVRVVNHTTPASRRGIAYSTYEGCGTILVPRHFSVNLDAHRPLARSMPGNDPDRPTPAIDFPYQVSLREPEVLMVSATTESCTCDWYLELDWSSQGRSGTVRIDDNGRPFRTTSIKGLPQYWYRNPGGWVPMTAADDQAETGG
ncbi:helix-turn-helix domain-containing protein [Streptomyces sp. DSM 3412]|uniref:Helix-turn-helix domain-containing protein n=1 Tax=Streptomyces gottesmaniae TaxID=3075518 RepID=A0ABU2Z3K3_9ACTN|nr:transcriptional regulator [Streptomyces sp. DSM 3412]MDT0571149.1 helix-turn-helix domain-containing protein [Streptomyces sp. DSM 3412]